MNFYIEKDINIFDPLLEKRPEISLENLKQDLKNYYLPYIQKLIGLRHEKTDSRGIIIGVSAIQGAGKTTQAEVLEILLSFLGHTSVGCSIDDHYITHDELLILQKKDPRFIRRGVTHNIDLAIQNLTDLQNMEAGSSVFLAAYDKGAHKGEGDRFRWVDMKKGMVLKARVLHDALVLDSLNFNNSQIDLPVNMGSEIPLEENILSEQLSTFLRNQNSEITIQYINDQIVFSCNNSTIQVLKKDMPVGWKLIEKKPDFIFYDGWMLGARKVADDSVFNGNLPALETEEARQFAREINQKLAEYEPLWNMIEFMNVLFVPNYQISLKWRDQAEEVLRAKGQGMSSEAIQEFVYYFWRSVHPAIQIKNLAHDNIHTQQVTVINDDHSIKEVLTSAETSIKYP